MALECFTLPELMDQDLGRASVQDPDEDCGGGQAEECPDASDH